MKRLISTNQENNININEFNKLLVNAIELYKEAMWNLATVIELGTRKFGRDNVTKMSRLEESRVNYLNSIIRVKGEKKHLLPELVYEITSSSNQKKWLKRAVDENLTPKELRKLIRNSQEKFHKEKKSSNGVVTWPRTLILLENELKKLPVEQKKIVHEKLARISPPIGI